MKERWRDIPEYEGLYQASDHGRIRSRSRIIKARSGGKARREGKILKVIPVRSYYQVTLYKNGKPKNMRLRGLWLWPGCRAHLHVEIGSEIKTETT